MGALSAERGRFGGRFEPRDLATPSSVPQGLLRSPPTQRSSSSPDAPRLNESEPADRPPAKFVASDRFVEQEVIGRGGMSLVVRAYDTVLDRDVAMKLIPPEASPTADDLRRLAEEARMIGRLEHPHIIPVYEFAVDQRGGGFFCMKLVKGETLEDTLCWAGPARLESEFLGDLLDIVLCVCDAIAYTHSRGILHLDLKPSNVMSGEFDQVYVVDWGVARPIARASRKGDAPEAPAPTSEKLFVGTPHYMAPEQLYGQKERLDERTDVFALGAMLYQILTKHPPRNEESLLEAAFHRKAIVITPPEALAHGLSVPAELSRIALKAMAHEPGDRYRSVRALARDIQAFSARRRPDVKRRGSLSSQRRS